MGDKIPKKEPVLSQPARSVPNDPVVPDVATSAYIPHAVVPSDGRERKMNVNIGTSSTTVWVMTALPVQAVVEVSTAP